MPAKHDPRQELLVSPVRAIAMILAQGVLRLQQRDKALDNRTEQRVHDSVLNPKGDTA